MNIKLIEKYLQFKKNIIVSGPTLSGKTRKVVFPFVDNLIYNNKNILLIDPKNEYLPRYEEILKSQNYNIISLDFNNDSSIEKFNILTIPSEHFKNDERTLCIQELRRISEILIKDTYNKDYTYARNSFIGIVLYLFASGKLNINLLDIKKIVSKSGIQELDSILINAREDEELSLYLENLYDNDLKYKICILINNILSSYTMNPNIANMLNETNITYDERPLAIIINASQNSKYVIDIINIYINQIYYYSKYKNIIMNIVIENYLDKDINLNLETMMLFSISNNIKFIISTNDLEEFQNKHGKFVLKSSDVINVLDKSIEIIQDTSKENFDKEFTFFNIDLCIKEASKEKETRDNVDYNKFNIFNDYPTLESTNIDSLLQKIGNRIDDIPEEEIKPIFKESIEIEEKDFEEFNSNPYNKIDFENELNLEKTQLNDEDTVENILEEFEMDNITSDNTNNLNENNNVDIDDIELDSNFDDLLNLIDKKILELDDTELIENDESDEKADVLDFMLKE